MNPSFPQQPDDALAVSLPYPDMSDLVTDSFQEPDHALGLSLPDISDADIFQQPENPLAASFSGYPNISDSITDFFQQPENTLAASLPVYPNISDPITDIFQLSDNTLPHLSLCTPTFLTHLYCPATVNSGNFEK